MSHSSQTQPMAAVPKQLAWFLPALFMLVVFATSRTTHASDQAVEANPLRVEALVDEVLEQNRGIAALKAAVQAAKAGIEQAGALPDPMLIGAVAPETIGGYESPSGRDANVRIELSQQLPWPGKLGLKEEAARLETMAATEDVAAMRLELVSLTRAAYAEWHYVHQALAINETNRELVEQLRSVAESRYAAGLASQQDVLQAEVELQHVRHRDIQLNRQHRATRARINTLLNRSPDNALPHPGTGLTTSAELPDFDELQSTALATHPELKRLDQRVAANEQRARLADKEFYPDFRVFTGYNGLWDEDAKRWVVGAGINLPIDRSKRRAAVDEAQARTMRLQAELDDRRAQLLGALEQALATADEARHTIRLYVNELIPRAEENLSAARAEYGAGGGGFLDVITAEKLLLNAQLGLERARADYFTAYADLQRWTGKPLTQVRATMKGMETQP
ncbi:MAG: TolC family protein [Nevskiales bacterium]